MRRVVLALSLFSACSDDPGRTSSDHFGGTSAADRRRASLVLAAFDAKVERCWNESPRGQIDAYPPHSYAFLRADLEYALLDPTEKGRAHLTESGAAACAASIDSAPCVIVERWQAVSMCTSTSAQRLALWAGVLPDSSACEHNAECASGYCRHGLSSFEESSGSYGRCRPPPHGEGALCHDWPCDAGFVCGESTDEDGPVCRAEPAGRVSCDNRYDSCPEGEVCANQRCAALPQIGDFCAYGWPGCASGLGCPAYYCEAAAPRGAACGNGAECALDDWCIDGTCAPRPLAGQACSEALPCRPDSTCVAELGEAEEAATLPNVCAPGWVLYSPAGLLETLDGEAFCVGCAPIQVVDEGPCDAYAGPRVCRHGTTTRYCEAAPKALEGLCADRPATGEGCDYFARPCVSLTDECYNGVCVKAGAPGDNCEDSPCGYGSTCYCRSSCTCVMDSR
jgi:hypothetical protein